MDKFNSQPGRLAWIDAAKGIAIILVVIGHAAGGLIDRPQHGHSTWLTTLFIWIYVIHMPLFMILSGLSVQARVTKSGPKFLQGIRNNIIWPYFLWSTLQILAIYAASSFVNAPIEEPSHIILRLPVSAPGQFWFLYALLVLHLISYVLLRTVGPTATVACLLVLSCLHGTVPVNTTVGATLMNAKWYALGLAAGMTWADERLRQERGQGPFWAVLSVTVLGLYVTHMKIIELHGATLEQFSAAALARAAWGPYAIPTAVVGAVAVMMLATHLKGTIASLLILLGKASMAIFALHIMMGAGTRIIAQNYLGIGSEVPLLLLITLVGIGGPLLALWVFSKTKVDAYLGLGSWPDNINALPPKQTT